MRRHLGRPVDIARWAPLTTEIVPLDPRSVLSGCKETLPQCLTQKDSHDHL